MISTRKSKLRRLSRASFSCHKNVTWETTLLFTTVLTSRAESYLCRLWSQENTLQIFFSNLNAVKRFAKKHVIHRTAAFPFFFGLHCATYNCSIRYTSDNIPPNKEKMSLLRFSTSVQSFFFTRGGKTKPILCNPRLCILSFFGRIFSQTHFCILSPSLFCNLRSRGRHACQ